MTKKTRRHHTPDQKINLLRRHHLEKVPVSEVCEGAELQPSVFYHWQRHLFDHGAAAFGESRKRGETSREQELLAENERLKARLARKDEVIAEVTEELVKVKKICWGSPDRPLGSHDERDQVVDFVHKWHETTEVPIVKFVDWLGVARAKFYEWRRRYGKANEHNGKIPRDHWIELWEREAIVDYFDKNPIEGYRRLTFMMLDDDIVAVSPATVYRVLRGAGRLDRNRPKPTKKGTGFVQPFGPHVHWHIDIAVITIAKTYYYLCSVLDGYSRFVVHWEFLDRMTEADIELILQRALEAYPDARPRIISDNGPQFIAGDFRRFINLAGLTHVRTSVNYPQSNGKIERYHRTLDKGTIHAATPDGVHDTIAARIDHYNNRRLHSAIGYVTPRDKLIGREDQIHADRDRKLEEARELRRKRRELDQADAAA